MMATHHKDSEKAAKVANFVLTAGAMLCVLVSCYAIYHYGWNSEKYQPNTVGIIVYYILPAVLAGALLFSLRLPPVRRVKLALVLSSTGISVYAVETALAILSLWFALPSVMRERDLRERVTMAEKVGVKFDQRKRLEVVRDLRKKGVEAYPTVSPLDFVLESPISVVEKQANVSLASSLTVDGAEIFPVSGHTRKVSVVCNEGGEYMIYESDGHGFHNPDALWQLDRVDIVALGDSFTQGYCVSSEKNFVARVRDRYPFTLNLGFAGHGPLQKLATLIEYVQPIKPKAVLWFYFEGNDLRDLRVERNYPLLMKYLGGGILPGSVQSAQRN